MRQLRLIRVILMATALFGMTAVHAADVDVTLRLGKQRFAVGESVRFEITIRNTSQQSITLLPQPRVFPADVFRILRIPDGKNAQIIRYGEQSVDYPGLAKQIVTLRPNRSVGCSIEADVSNRLPNFYHDKRPGPYLVFPGSAIRLPSFGKYLVTAIFHFPPNHPVEAFLSRRQVLWHGDGVSNAVVVEFSK